jgi:PHD/YefM family antitoxin component YafN of YafNO toxin-antitoxin module
MATKAKGKKPKSIRIPLEEAQAEIVPLVEHVRGGDKYVIFEKDGESVAILVDIDEFEDYLELLNPEVNEIIAEGNREYLAGLSRPAEELLAELKAEEEEEERERAKRAAG